MDKSSVSLALIIGFVIVIIVTPALCSNSGGTSTSDETAWPVFRLLNGWLNDEAAKREASAQIAALRVTETWLKLNATPTSMPTPTPTPLPKPAIVSTARTLSEMLVTLAWGLAAIGLVVMTLWMLSKIPLWIERRARTGQQRGAGADYLLRDGSIGSTDKSTGTITPRREQYDWLVVWDRCWSYLLRGEIRPLPEAQTPLMAHRLSAQQAVELAMVDAKFNGEAAAAQAQRLPDMPRSVAGGFTLQIGARDKPAPMQVGASGAEILDLTSSRDNQWKLMAGVLNQLGLDAPKPSAQGDVVDG